MHVTSRAMQHGAMGHGPGLWPDFRHAPSSLSNIVSTGGVPCLMAVYDYGPCPAPARPLPRALALVPWPGPGAWGGCPGPGV